MSLLSQLSKVFGINHETPLTEVESRLFNQLQSNREVALETIPPDMKREFLSSVYSDRELRWCVTEIYRDKLVSEDRRGEFLKLAISGCLGIHGFGRNLLLHRIYPETVAEIMLRGINLEQRSH